MESFHSRVETQHENRVGIDGNPLRYGTGYMAPIATLLGIPSQSKFSVGCFGIAAEEDGCQSKQSTQETSDKLDYKVEAQRDGIGLDFKVVP